MSNDRRGKSRKNACLREDRRTRETIQREGDLYILKVHRQRLVRTEGTLKLSQSEAGVEREVKKHSTDKGAVSKHYAEGGKERKRSIWTRCIGKRCKLKGAGCSLN